MNRKKFGRNIYRVSSLKGRFVLRSGIIADKYFDKYQFESRPELLREIAKRMIKLVPEGTEVLAGLEMGAIPIVAAMSILDKEETPAVFVRKAAKEYGTRKQVEGVSVKEKKVCVVEDVVTSGGALLDAVGVLRKDGAVVSNALCVILRGRDVVEKLDNEGVLLTPLFTQEELENAK
jgi:orotate phosphoribosyltransferase